MDTAVRVQYMKTTFLVAIVIPELAKAGTLTTLTLTFTRTGGLALDPTAPRVFSFNSAFDQPGSHNATLVLPSQAATTPGTRTSTDGQTKTRSC